MVDRDRYLDMHVQAPSSIAEASERIAESMGGTLLTRQKPFTAELFDQNPSVSRDREAYGVDVSAFCHAVSHNEDGTPKSLPGPYRIENNHGEDLLAFEDLCSALGATHHARLSSALAEANAQGVDVDGFNWDQADPLNPSFVLKQVAEELGLKPIDAEHPVPLDEAWKILAVDTYRQVRKRLRDRVQAKVSTIVASETISKLLKRANDTQTPPPYGPGEVIL